MREKIRHHITHNHLCDNDNAIWYDQMNHIFEYFDSYCHLKNIIQYLYDRYIMYKWLQILFLIQLNLHKLHMIKGALQCKALCWLKFSSTFKD